MIGLTAFLLLAASVPPSTGDGSVDQVFKQDAPQGAALVVGVGKYQSADIPKILGPENDAAAVGGAARYQNLNVHILSNTMATRMRVLRLVQSDVVAHEPFMVFISGRGEKLNDAASFGAPSSWFLPYDAQLGKPERLIGEPDLKALARTALGYGASRVVFVIDTCFSGGFDLNFDSRVTAICSAGPLEYAWNSKSPSGVDYGSFSYGFATALSHLHSWTTFGDVAATIRSRMQTASTIQIQGESSQLFLDGISRDTKFFTMHLDGKVSSINALSVPLGEASGLGPGSEFEVRTVPGHDGVGRYAIPISADTKSIGSSTATLTKLFGNTAPSVVSVAPVLSVTNYPAPSINLDMLPDSDFRTAIKTKAESQGIRIVHQSEVATLKFDFSGASEIARDSTSGHGALISGPQPTRPAPTLQLRRGDGTFIQTVNLAKLKQFPSDILDRPSGMIWQFAKWDELSYVNPLRTKVHLEAELFPVTMTSDNQVEKILPNPQTNGEIRVSPRGRYSLRIKATTSDTSAKTKPVFVYGLDLDIDGKFHSIWNLSPGQPLEFLQILPNGKWFYPSVQGRFLSENSLDPSKLAAWSFPDKPGQREYFKFYTCDKFVDVRESLSGFSGTTRAPGGRDGDNFGPFTIKINENGTTSVTQREDTPWAEACIPIRAVSDEDLIGRQANDSVARTNLLLIAPKGAAAAGNIENPNVIIKRVSFEDSDLEHAEAFLLDEFKNAKSDEGMIVSFRCRCHFDQDGEPVLNLGPKAQLPISGLQTLLATCRAARQTVLLGGCDLRNLSDKVSLKRLFGRSYRRNSHFALFASPDLGQESLQAEFAKAASLRGSGLLVQDLTRELSKGALAAKGILRSFNLGGDFAIIPPGKPVIADIQAASCQEDPSRSTEKANPPKGSGIRKKYALLIGCSTYINGAAVSLVNPKKDISNLRDSLKNVGFEVYELLDPGATPDDLQAHKLGTQAVYDAIGEFDPADPRHVLPQSELKPEDELLVFYAGHGGLDNRCSFLVFGDTLQLPLSRNATALQLSSLMQAIDPLPFNRIAVVLDMCYGGQGIGSLPQAFNLANSGTAPDLLYRSITASSFYEAPDGTPGDGSPFANKFKDILGSASNEITLDDIVYQISKGETDEAKKPIPGWYRHAPLQFYFVKKN